MSILSDAEKKAFADHTALGRWGDPKELVGPALLLASDAGSYITGETLVVDGGYVVRVDRRGTDACCRRGRAYLVRPACTGPCIDA